MGDFLAGLALIRDVAEALRETGGAADHYQNLQRELDGLATALAAVDKCHLQVGSEEFAIAAEAANDCHAIIARFVTKHAKYNDLLKNLPPGSKEKREGWFRIKSRSNDGSSQEKPCTDDDPFTRKSDAEVEAEIECEVQDIPEEDGRARAIAMLRPMRRELHKVRWALCHKESIEKLQKSLAVRTSALNLLLAAVHVSQQARQANQLETLQSRLEDTQIENRALLKDVQSRLECAEKDKQQLLEKIEGLLLGNLPEYDDKQGPFVIRPLKLVGAPVIEHVVERRELIRTIEDAILPVRTGEQNIVVLAGMGGIGKSQLARMIALRHHDSGDFSAVFWINAKTEQRVRISLAEVAEQIRLPDVVNSRGRVEKTEAGITTAIDAVLEWLTREGNDRWLLIFDNLDSQMTDEEDVKQEKPEGTNDTFDICPHLPEVSHGTILITSRLSFLDRTLGAQTICVEEMTEDEAIELLCGSSGVDAGDPGQTSTSWSDRYTDRWQISRPSWRG